MVQQVLPELLSGPSQYTTHLFHKRVLGFVFCEFFAQVVNGVLFFSVSSYWPNTQPIDFSWIVKYRMRGFLGIGGTKIGEVDK